MTNCSILNQFKNIINNKRRAVKEILCVTGKSYPQSCRLYTKALKHRKDLFHEVLIKWAPQHLSMLQIFSHS